MSDSFIQRLLRHRLFGFRSVQRQQRDQCSETKACRHHDHKASHGLNQQAKRQRRQRLTDAGWRPDQSEPVGVVFGAEDRERQRTPRDGQDSIARAVQQGESGRGPAAEDADHTGADRMGDAGKPRGDDRVKTVEEDSLQSGAHRPGQVRSSCRRKRPAPASLRKPRRCVADAQPSPRSRSRRLRKRTTTAPSSGRSKCEVLRQVLRRRAPSRRAAGKD